MATLSGVLEIYHKHCSAPMCTFTGKRRRCLRQLQCQFCSSEAPVSLIAPGNTVVVQMDSIFYAEYDQDPAKGLVLDTLFVHV